MYVALAIVSSLYILARDSEALSDQFQETDPQCISRYDSYEVE